MWKNFWQIDDTGGFQSYVHLSISKVAAFTSPLNCARSNSFELFKQASRYYSEFGATNRIAFTIHVIDGVTHTPVLFVTISLCPHSSTATTSLQLAIASRGVRP